MKKFCIIILALLSFACGRPQADDSSQPGKNLLVDYSSFTHDSLVQVVIEIPAGTNEKWEVNKTTGQLEWQVLENGEKRIIQYLAYPANYGFVPQTLVPESTGGDGDPADVFVLGSALIRGSVVKVKIIGMIHMLDENEADPKLLAVHTDDAVFTVNSFEELKERYPGVLEIIKQWLANYKGANRIEIISEGDEKEALSYVNEAHKSFINN